MGKIEKKLLAWGEEIKSCLGHVDFGLNVQGKGQVGQKYLGLKLKEDFGQYKKEWEYLNQT